MLLPALLTLSCLIFSAASRGSRAEDYAQTGLAGLDRLQPGALEWPLQPSEAAGASRAHAGELVRSRLLGLVQPAGARHGPSRAEQIRSAARRLLLLDMGRAARAPAALDSGAEQELRVYQKKAEPASSKEIEGWVESAIESANKYTRDPSKQRETRPEWQVTPAATALGSSGHKTIRTEHPIYMRLPPRFGKRAAGLARETCAPALSTN